MNKIRKLNDLIKVSQDKIIQGQVEYSIVLQIAFHIILISQITTVNK